MRAVVQRVREASVRVSSELVAEIGPGLSVLVGVTHGDEQKDAAALAAKLVGLRIFADEEGRFNRSIVEVGGSMLVVSQFTLYGDVRKGRRPSFTDAAEPEAAAALIGVLVDNIEAAGVTVAEGRFGARMEVSLVNDGPVTLVLEARDGRVV